MKTKRKIDLRPEKFRVGDNFTIEGFGKGRDGQLVIDGINPVTRRKCRAVSQMIFTVGKEVVSNH